MSAPLSKLAAKIGALRCFINQTVLRRELLPPVLILGSPHSGTSLLAAMLDSHRSLATYPMETGVFFVGKKKIPGTIAALEKFAHTRGARRWVEKTPDHLLHIKTIRELMPSARILMTVRDGRDVTASLKARFGNFRQALDTWKIAARATLDQQNAADVHWVRYEELVQEPGRVLTGICEFIGEPFDPGMLQYHQRKRFWYTPTIEKPSDASAANHPAHRNWQINQPLFNGGGRWKKDLTEEEQQIFQTEGGPILAALGYGAAE